MIITDEKGKSPKEIITKKKEELYAEWLKGTERLDELENLERYIDGMMKEIYGPGKCRTASEIANELRDVLINNKVPFTTISDAILVYLAELLKV